MLSPSSASLLLFALLSSTTSASSQASLGKRGSLHPRQSECIDPGWIPACPNAVFPCAPPGATCCSDGEHYAPLGASCCSDGEHYSLPPLIVCPPGSSPIDPSAPSAPSITPAPSTPPPSPSTIVEYTWYTWTITYYYYYYFYTFVDFVEYTSSTRTTFYTTVSLTATDDVQASAALTSLSAALEKEIPEQTATPTVGSVPASTRPTPTPTPEETPSVSSVGYSIPPVESSSGTAATGSSYPTGNGTLPSTAVPVPSEFPGAAARAHGTAGLAMLAGALGMVVPGVMMVWL